MPILAIVGARFRPPAKEVLDNLSSGTKLLLRRQPDNPYDMNAVQVLLPLDQDHGETVNTLIQGAEVDMSEPLHLGFIPRGDAVEVAKWMDKMGNDPSMEYEEGWPATLTFLPSGQPAVSFEEPSE